MKRRAFLGLLPGLLVVSCGGGAGDYLDPSPSPSPAQTRTPTPDALATPTPAPTELRVAFINLMSPVSLDATSTVASDTYDERLDAIIQELQAFKPDVVGFSEVTVTKAHGSAAAKLARELKMEIQYVRANPWFPGQTREQNDAIAKQIGFEEGELILSRSAFPILRADSTWLNPRTSETEVRAGLHVVVKGPPVTGDIDVYITHLTGGGEKLRSAQAQSFVEWIGNTRGPGPLVAMGDLSDGPKTTTYQAFLNAGLQDVGVVASSPTCCREQIVGQQPAVTQRTDFVFAYNLATPTVATFGDKPHKRADGSLLYASDHNGIEVVFPIVSPGPEVP